MNELAEHPRRRKDHPTVLPEVTVTSKPRTLNQDQLQGLYWGLRNSGIGFEGVKNNALRTRLERWDGIQRFMENVHQQTREQDEIALQVGAIFVPVGDIVEAANLGRIGINLFRLKRGLLVEQALVENTTVIGEGMARVKNIAAEIPGARILNDMPEFLGNSDEITSQMMTYNRKWILNEMRSGGTILDIGIDASRTERSIFYEMEQNMLKNYQKLYPNSLKIITP